MLRRFAVYPLIVFVLSACGDPPQEADPAPVAEDLLFVSSGSGVSLFPTDGEGAAFTGVATPSSNWRTAVRTLGGVKRTVVDAVDPTTGAARWTRYIDGAFETELVSEDGNLVVLTPSGERFYAQGRKETTFVIVDGRGGEPQHLTLEGNYEPEAFSVDGKNLFVIEYLPANAPNSYRVRRLDLTTGRVGAVYTADEELQERMRGTARIQTMSSDGTRLYTLYALAGTKREPSRAFIHVLSLDELWAHCVDLPLEFGSPLYDGAVVALSPDDERLYVANSGTEVIAEVDTDTLQVVDTGTVDTVPSWSNYGVVGKSGTFYFASRRQVSAVDTDLLAASDHWVMEGRISGLQLSADEQKLYVALKSSIVAIDVASGETLETFEPKLGRITGLGRSTRTLEETPPEITCAC